METDINIKVNTFFEKYKLNEITPENVKKHFKNIKEINDYGGLLHAAVQNKFPEDKVLKFIDTLLQCDVDVNLKGEVTGYSFIHLALYGYTENEEDYSYSTEFIIKLISLAKKYSFDVNIKDNDNDSIIHTALASETYTGDTSILINTLGDEYDILCKDNNERNIYEALLEYKKEAERDKNKTWYDRLVREEDEISRLVRRKLESLDKSKRIEQVDNLKLELEELLSNANIDYVLLNYQSILNNKKDITSYIEEDISLKDKESLIKLRTKLDKLLKEIINNYLKLIKENPNYKDINNLIKVLTILGYEEELQALNNIKSQYDELIQNINNKINNIKTINEIEPVKKDIDGINDKERLIEEINKKEELFLKKIEELKNNISIINAIKELKIIEVSTKKLENIDYSNMTLEDILSLTNETSIEIENSKQNILENIKEKLQQLKAIEIFTDEELLVLFEPNANRESKNNKKRKYQNVKR